MRLASNSVRCPIVVALSMLVRLSARGRSSACENVARRLRAAAGGASPLTLCARRLLAKTDEEEEDSLMREPLECGSSAASRRAVARRECEAEGRMVRVAEREEVVEERRSSLGVMASSSFGLAGTGRTCALGNCRSSCTREKPSGQNSFPSV